MAEKQELWLATDGNGVGGIYGGDPKWSDEQQQFGGDLIIVTDLRRAVPPGHKARLTIGEAVDCRPKVPVSETAAAMAALNKAAEKLPQGYRVGVDFGDRAGISVFGNGEVLKHDCDSFDIAVEIANDHVWSEAKIPKLWAWRVDKELISILRDMGHFFTIKASELPELEHLHKCRIAWDENGIRLIGTPEPI